MDDNKSTCPKCSSEMETGFIAEFTLFGGRLQNNWVEGVTEKSSLSCVKVKGKKSYDVISYRCVSCGYLESYAN